VAVTAGQTIIEDEGPHYGRSFAGEGELLVAS
jgi:hypothetical protein